ncbi:hypothetical protein [Symbiopectobacterium purcellii]|uniref:Uncharacterized protein n=1 Tax=Symbiopectobacterium purcellii TaxID=2871826 RepID=A0ABX9ATX2_9ENTR|nr:hypothetical protein [Symbiopectobacterium purcellii]QZN98216.1 hypothetical protein K6K13_17310 [Symbiopectobacterium purcellii]
MLVNLVLMLFFVHVGGVFSFCGFANMSFNDVMNVAAVNIVALSIVAMNMDATFLPILKGIRGFCAVNQFYGLWITRADLHGITA